MIAALVFMIVYFAVIKGNLAEAAIQVEIDQCLGNYNCSRGRAEATTRLTTKILTRYTSYSEA
jgi:hypothetical protein